jgi:hypothetical protein
MSGSEREASSFLNPSSQTPVRCRFTQPNAFLGHPVRKLGILALVWFVIFTLTQAVTYLWFLAMR